MRDTVIEERTSIPKADEWAKQIAAQQRSGTSVKQFCKEQGLTEYSFYAWRKRLQKKEPVRFALVDRRAARQESATETALELVLTTGERLRIGAEWTQRHCAPYWKLCGHDPFAGQRAGISLPDCMRHAQEL